MKPKSIESCLVLAFAAAAAMAVAVTLNGYVISIIWGWFIVPIFGLPPLAIAEAVAVVLVARVIANPVSKSSGKTPDWEEWLSDFIAYSVLGPFMILGLAWIVRLFVERGG